MLFVLRSSELEFAGEQVEGVRYEDLQIPMPAKVKLARQPHGIRWRRQANGLRKKIHLLLPPDDDGYLHRARSRPLDDATTVLGGPFQNRLESLGGRVEIDVSGIDLTTLQSRVGSHGAAPDDHELETLVREIREEVNEILYRTCFFLGFGGHSLQNSL